LVSSLMRGEEKKPGGGRGGGREQQRSIRELFTGLAIGFISGFLVSEQHGKLDPTWSQTIEIPERVLQDAVDPATAVVKDPAIFNVVDGDNVNNHAVDDDGWKCLNVFYGKHEHLTPFYWKPRRKKFSQLGQDEVVWDVLGKLEGGYFVDLAANDATFLSNTYWLETEHGWNGLCLEANPKYWARHAYRKCTLVGAVVGAKRMEEIDFNFGPKSNFQIALDTYIEGGELGGIVRDDFDNNNETDTSAGGEDHVVAKRYTVPLDEVFRRHNVPKVIDYFSLDVEGAESYVMSTFPFDKYSFRVLTIERPKPDLKEVLKAKGYSFIKSLSTWGEELWYHPNHLNLTAVS